MKQSLDVEAYEAATSIVHVPIRGDLIIRIQGIPFDFSKHEAEKIAAIVMAYSGTAASHRDGE